MISKTFTTKDQLDAEGKVVDKIFTITNTETIITETQEAFSGTEVKEKIKLLENKEKQIQEELLKVQEQINFYKSLE